MASDEEQVRLSDDVIEAVRRHVEDPELAAYSLRLGVTFHPDWPDDPAAQVEVINNILIDIPSDRVDEEGRAAALEAVRQEMEL